MYLILNVEYNLQALANSWLEMRVSNKVYRECDMAAELGIINAYPEKPHEKKTGEEGINELKVRQSFNLQPISIKT